jgi:hypothetical protein
MANPTKRLSQQLYSIAVFGFLGVVYCAFHINGNSSDKWVYGAGFLTGTLALVGSACGLGVIAVLKNQEARIEKLEQQLGEPR